MTEKERDLEKRERGDREQSTVTERKRGTGKRGNYTEGKGRGQGGTGTQKRGDMTPRAQDSPEFLPSALPGKFQTSGTSFSLCLSFPPFLFRRHLTVLHLREHIGILQPFQHEASSIHSHADTLHGHTVTFLPSTAPAVHVGHLLG